MITVTDKMKQAAADMIADGHDYVATVYCGLPEGYLIGNYPDGAWIVFDGETADLDKMQKVVKVV